MTALEALIRGEAPALEGLLHEELVLTVARGQIEGELRRLSQRIDAALERDVPTRLRPVEAPGGTQDARGVGAGPTPSPGVARETCRTRPEHFAGAAGPTPSPGVARGPWPARKTTGGVPK